MRKENVRCPMCGTMNYDVDLDETGGWTKCRLCKAVTCSMDEWKKHTVSVPLLNEKQLVARSTAEAAGKRCDPYRDTETDRVPQKEQKNSRRGLPVSGGQRRRMGKSAV